MNVSKLNNLLTVKLLPTFDVTSNLLWEYLTDKNLRKHWEVPENFSVVEIKQQLYQGGWWSISLQDDAKKIYTSCGVYHTVLVNKRLTYTHLWRRESDKNLYQTEPTIVDMRLEKMENNRTRILFKHYGFRAIINYKAHLTAWKIFFVNLENCLKKPIEVLNIKNEEQKPTEQEANKSNSENAIVLSKKNPEEQTDNKLTKIEKNSPKDDESFTYNFIT